MLNWRRRIVLRTCGWQVDPPVRWILVWVDRWKSTPWKGRVAWPWTSCSGVRVRRVGPRNVAEAVGWPRRSGRSTLSRYCTVIRTSRWIGAVSRSPETQLSARVVVDRACRIPIRRRLFDARFDCSAHRE